MLSSSLRVSNAEQSWRFTGHLPHPYIMIKYGWWCWWKKKMTKSFPMWTPLNISVQLIYGRYVVDGIANVEEGLEPDWSPPENWMTRLTPPYNETTNHV